MEEKEQKSREKEVLRLKVEKNNRRKQGKNEHRNEDRSRDTVSEEKENTQK